MKQVYILLLILLILLVTLLLLVALYSFSRRDYSDSGGWEEDCRGLC